MFYRNRKIIILLTALSVLFMVIKLFTTVLLLKDDPTNVLTLRYIPAWDNQLTFNTIQNQNY